MKVFKRKAIKDLKQFGWRSFLIVFILILSVGGSLAFIYVIFSADRWMDNYFTEVNYADYTYELDDSTWIDEDKIDDIKDLDEVEDCTGRLFWRTSLKISGVDELKFIVLVGLDEDEDWPDVNSYHIEEGENFNEDGDDNVVIDKDFAERNELDIGDKVKLKGFDDQKVEITGTCNSPEFVMMTSNPEYAIPIQGSITVGYCSQETLKNYILDYFNALNASTPEDLTTTILYYNSVNYNSIAVTFDDDVTAKEGNKAVEDYLEDDCNVNIKNAEYYEDSIAYETLRDNLGKAKQFIIIILVFMFLMGLFITFVIFNRYILNQKQQIGMLTSFGYTRTDINQYFLQIFLIVAVISVPVSLIVGYILGDMLLGVVISNMANITVESLNFIFIPELIYIGLPVGTFIIFISLYIPMRKVKRIVVSDLIYGTASSKFFILRFRRNKKLRKTVSNTLIHRNLFRYKKRLVLTTIGMTFSLLIISATQTITDSMYFNVARVFKTPGSDVEANENWDLNVDFQTSVDIDDINNTIDQIKEIKEIDDYEYYTKGLITAKGEDDQQFLIVGYDAEDSDMHQFTVWDEDQDTTKEDENKIPKKDNEIVISYTHALKLDKGIGDKLKIKNAFDDEFEFKIVGVHKEMITTGYVNLDAGYDIFHDGNETVDALYLTLKDLDDKQDVIEEIYDLENIEIIFDSAIMSDKLMEFFSDFIPMMMLVVAYSLLVSFFVIFYNSIMNIYDKNYEYGILRALGYSKVRLFRLILGENMTQGSGSIGLALIFTYPLSLLLASIFQTDSPFEVVIGVTAIMYIIIPPIILIILGSLISLRTIYRYNLYEQVQTRFIG